MHAKPPCPAGVSMDTFPCPRWDSAFVSPLEGDVISVYPPFLKGGRGDFKLMIQEKSPSIPL